MHDKILQKIKENVLDLMRHNQYGTARFIIDVDEHCDMVKIHLEKTSREKCHGKTVKRIIEIEKIYPVA